MQTVIRQSSGNNGHHALLRMRRFFLKRNADVSGVSGIGVVAEGVRFTDGRVVLMWLRPPHAISVYGSIGEMLGVHGHEGSTTLMWLDDAT